MLTRARCVALGTLILCTSVAAAETEPWNRSGLWRLRPASSMIRGCFDPCACPVYIEDALRGEFTLSLVAIGDVFDFYDVNDMAVRAPVIGWTFAGEGDFRFSQVAGLEAMSVTLTLDGQSPENFNGESTVPANPDTMDLEINVNNRFCFDTVLRLVAARCRADWDRSGAVTPVDVASFIAAWVSSLSENTLEADYDGNGAVTPGDVAVMVAAWFDTLAGAPCG